MACLQQEAISTGVASQTLGKRRWETTTFCELISLIQLVTSFAYRVIIYIYIAIATTPVLVLACTFHLFVNV